MQFTNMDKMVAGAVKKVMGAGEKVAPVKSIKLKVKFSNAKGEALKKAKMGDEIHRKRVGNDMRNK